MKIRAVLPVILFVLCLLLLQTPCATAAVAETTLSVAIQNEHDKPVANAAVIVDFLGSHQIMKLGKRKATHWEIHTNQEGKAHFPPIPEGQIQLQVITKTYQTYGEKIELAGAEKLMEITLHPPQSQYSAHPPLKPADPPK
jgi:hypothetical protein